MIKRTLLFFCLVLSFAVVGAVAAKADDAVATSYLHLRNSLGVVPGSITDLTNDQNSQVQTAKYYEFSGRIVGQVSSDDQPVVLLQSGSVSTEVEASETFLSSTDWMNTGNVVRVLVKSAPNPNGDGNLPALVLISAGPEDNISALEKTLAADDAKAALAAKARMQSRSVLETSRSGSFPSRYVQSSVPVTGLSDRAAAIFPAYYNMICRLNPKLSDSDATSITKSILYYADVYQLDPRLIVAMVTAESGFDPYSVSRTGAMGLGQLMPETANEHGVTNAFDPQQNIMAAVQILSSHVQQYGGAEPCGVVPINTLLLTMAAYNAGEGAVKKYGGVPPYKETQNYVRKVNEIYRQLCGS